ncbi:MAG: hypothetical protein JWQ38_3323 [Flavipsychrobacter sp.]|nr:hypothetical protein [Flavipsychrobacter sp.]
MLLLLVAADLSATNAVAQQSADNTIQTITRNKVDNTPKTILFSANANWSVGQEQDIFRKYLGLNGAENTIVPGNSAKTKSNTITVRYAQYFKDIKVEYGVVTLTSKEGHINFLTSNFYNTDNSLSTTPAISESDALKSALASVGAQKYMWEDASMGIRLKRHYGKDTSYFPVGHLVWIEDYSNGMNADRQLHLAYKFDVYAQAPVSRNEIFVDANTGKILFSNSLLKHITAPGSNSLYSGPVTIETNLVGPDYILQDLTRGSGVHTLDMQGLTSGPGVEITNATNNWTGPTVDSVAIDAQWGGEKVYDFWLSMGRLSYDGADGLMEQYVHYDVNYNNAFWDGTEMIYGDGTGCAASGFTPLAALDVTAHEIGHAVCQYTANLVYAGESGAMNEGFSDCWGATIEAVSDPHETDAVTKKTWYLGEELGCGNPLRRMDFPKIKGDPDTYNGTNWVSQIACTPTSGNDQCGVHTNSGLLNKWYFLITDGGSGTNDVGNAYIVDGLGFAVSSQILYATELALTSTADYNDCMNTSIGIATGIYGPCSREVQAITNAWYAINVRSTAFVPCVPMIGFTAHNMAISENAATLTCPAAKTYVISVQPTTTGPLISGGNPIVNIVYGRGSAVAGINYTVTPSSLTFPVGSTAAKTATLTVMDNGAVNDTKDLVLALTITPAGSNAILSFTNDSLYINITNDDAAPEHIEYNTMDIGTPGTSNLTSAFPGAFSREHTQYLLRVADLTAAGVKPNSPISQIAFHIVGKNSTSPFVNYTLSMGHTLLTDLNSSMVSAGLTAVYSGSPDTYIGWDTLDYNLATFTWNGTSNVIVDICYGKNATTGGNDQMDAITTSYIANDHNGTSTGSGSACPALGFSSGGTNTARPVMRFKQTVPPGTVSAGAGIETAAASTRTWDVHAGQEVYFFNNSDNKLIAGLKNISNDLGCVTSTVAQAGVGFTPAVFSPVNRSRKEITITPTINGSSTTYDATIYFTTAELAGATPSSLYLIKTDEPTDATINTTNSVALSPTLFNAPGYVGFKGTFTGFSRFFLIDGPLCTAPSPSVTAGGPTAFCPGDNVVLSASTGTGLTYQWQKGGLDIFGETNTTYTATLPGNYTVKEFSGACNATSSGITVSYAPPSAGTIVGSMNACVGQTITLSDAIAGTWSSATSSVATIGSASGIVTGVAVGTAVISYDVNNACGAATTTATITVNSSPAVAAVTGGMSICAASGSTTLSDATPSGVWSSGSTATATVNSSGVVTAGVAGVAPISYSVTNGFGCTASAIGSVTVNALPNPVITTPGLPTICSGGSLTMSATTGAGYTYQWLVSGGGIAGATSSSYTTSTVGNYSVNIVDGNGCGNESAVTTVTLSGIAIIPSVSINVTPGTTVCASGLFVSYVPVPVNGGTTPVYNWYVNGTLKTTGPSYSYSPANSDIVKVKMTSNAACVSPDTAISSVTMTVSPYETPSVSITSMPGNPVCEGTYTTYSAVTLFGGTAPTYQWTKNGIPVATGPAYKYYPANGDILVCRMVSDYGCLLTPFATSNSFVTSVSPLVVNKITIHASKLVIASGQAVTFSVVAPVVGTTYQWYLDGVIIPGATTTTYTTKTLSEGQVVTCSATNTDACVSPATSYSVGIKVHVGGTGIAGLGNSISNFTLVPNPNKGTFTISGTLKNTADNNVDITITNMLGQVIYKHNVVADNNLISENIILPAATANGMYLVNVTSGEDHAVFHVVLDK